MLRNHLPTPIAERIGLRADISEVRAKQVPLLTAAFAKRDLHFGQTIFYGAPAYIPIFKEEGELELWLNYQPVGETALEFILFKAYPICTHESSSTDVSTNTELPPIDGLFEIDHASLYALSEHDLRVTFGPHSQKQAIADGSFLSGICGQADGFSLQPNDMAELFIILEAALDAGETVPLHVFPFHMTQANLRPTANVWHQQELDVLKMAYDVFAITKQPPKILTAKPRI